MRLWTMFAALCVLLTLALFATAAPQAPRPPQAPPVLEVAAVVTCEECPDGCPCGCRNGAPCNCERLKQQRRDYIRKHKHRIIKVAGYSATRRPRQARQAAPVFAPLPAFRGSFGGGGGCSGGGCR